MNIKKQISLITLFVLVVITIMSYIFQQKLHELQTQEYTSDVTNIKAYLKNLIDEKQKSTMIVAESLAQGSRIKKIFLNTNVEANRAELQKISQDFNKHTMYKNVWIQLIDTHGVSLIRSWTEDHNDSLATTRMDIKELLKNPQPFSCISTGKYTISFKATVPVYRGNRELLGFIEVITHFNSISKELKKGGYDSILLVDKLYKEQLTNNISKKFIGDYYIANFTSSNYVIDLIQHLGTQRTINNQTYLFQEKYFVTEYTIRDIHNKPMAYYILIKNINLFKYKSNDNFISYIQNVTIISIFFTIFMALIFYKRHQDIDAQKKYFHNIVDTASEIIIIIQNGRAVDVNRAFFDFFNEFSTLEEFHKYTYCICDLFVQEEGYITKEMGSLTWIEYITQNNHLDNRVKIVHNHQEYIFNVAIERLHHKNQDTYTFALTDITKMQAYQKKLEYLSQTDMLTKVGNRRYFDIKIKVEILRARRYNKRLSLIMFDIDFFKKINDTYGHDIGDKALITLAEEIKSLLRISDIFCRYGGEEFMILMPESSFEEASISAERIRQHVQALQIEPIEKMTISLGVTELINEDTMISFVKRVDKALYRAKEGGRNRVISL